MGRASSRGVGWTAVVLPAVVLLVGCAQAVGSNGPSPFPSAASMPAAIDPGLVLVGLWKVDAAGEGDRTWVAFTSQDLTVERDRRLIFGSWVTGDDRIAAVRNGWDGRIADPSVPWLEHASSFRRSGQDITLQAADGAVLATLTRATTAPPPRNAVPELMEVPTIAPTEASAFTQPTPPADPGPTVTEASLLGRWRTGDTAADGSRPTLTFTADGRYVGSDGCNGIGGRWLLLPGNRLRLTVSGQTAMACPNIQPVGTWVGEARAVSVRNGALTLYDVTGTRLGAFDRR